MSLDHLAVKNLRRLAPETWTGGQPTAEELRQARAAGLRSVINLCPAGECGWDEKTVAETLGLHYTGIPIGGAGDLSLEAARQLHQALEAAPKPVLVHCASSNRVGALFALKAHFVEGLPGDLALAHGRQAGLAALEAAVRQLMA